MEKKTFQMNEFHRISVEKKLKAIAEMKKSPMNYEEEYEKHKRISQLGREPEKTQE